ncbi:MAG: hypothetical protein E7267_00090 [Lachnospiraceae bacterium]|nr:hypothetical protein [Lachnospiraceae bacterium]
MKKNNSGKNEKKRKRVDIIFFLRAIVVLLVLIVCIPIICYLVVHKTDKASFIYAEIEAQVSKLEEREAAIVPGGGVSEEIPGVIVRDRLDMARKAYEQGAIDFIIVSGGSEHEVEIMAKYLMSEKVPREDIDIDAYGTNTYATVTRVAEKYDLESYYFCTQEMYADRAGYLMRQAGLAGQVICVDTMYYSISGKARVREFLAATKAVFEPIVRGRKPKTSIEEADFGETPEYIENEKNDSLITAEDLEIAKDSVVKDINLNDEYDVEKAVAYARKYALEANSEYPLFEQNCTNFVSQCLREGGLAEEGEGKISKRNKYRIKENKSDWFSCSEINEKTGRIHYSTTYNFINTERFIEYFTKSRGYEFTMYENDYEGRLECYGDIASGDILIFYGEKDNVEHLGLVTGIGDMNAYYCANTNAKLDYGVFTINDTVYPKLGIIHMSGKK